MKLYADYIKELNNRDCVYNDKCFVTYKVYKDEVSIIDYFCSKEHRGKGYMLTFMTDMFKNFKKDGYKKAYGFTDTRNVGWKRSERLMFEFGFEYVGKSPDDKYYNNYVINLEEL